MKTAILFLLAVSITATGFAQAKGRVKLYGFEQFVSKGKAPEIDSQTGLRTSEGAGKNYHLYAVSPFRVYPAEIWLDGTRFGVTMRTVQQTPVTYTDAGNIGAPEKVLVPKTKQRVIQLVPSSSASAKSVGRRAKLLAETNAVVFVYRQNGKFYYNTLKSLHNLDDVAAQ